jgi:aldehyde:ferredoxin oxidoreductase
MNGYGGSILRVNLTEGRITKTPTSPELARDYIGGRGFGIYTLYHEVPKGADPLGPENKLIVSTGPFAGTMVPGGGKCDWTTKSPLTGGYADASMGGHFTAEMRYAGIDSIILEGISPKPVYLFIDDNKIELRDAAPYWGKGAFDVEDEFKKKYGEEFQIAAIGQGGENGVLYACVNHDIGRQAGRGGVGAVMGSKKVKAIVLHGTKSIPVADVAGLRTAALALFKACKEAEGTKDWTRYGTNIVASWCDEVGALPTHNFQAGSFEGAKTLSGPVMREQLVIMDKGCFACPCPCGKYSRLKKYNSHLEGPEYETVGLFGANLGISDLQDVGESNRLCDEYGIDAISTGVCIGWAMECYEHGILTKADCDGLDLKWGNVEAVHELIRKIAFREGKLGALLAEGTKKASAKVGEGSEKFAIHVKGMEQSAYATHSATAMLLAYMTGDVGAHHNRSWAITYDLQVGRDKVVPEKVARIIWLQDFRPMFETLGCCRLQWVELGIDRDLYMPALDAIVGGKHTWKEMEHIGARIWNLTRLFWARENEGFGREWDMPSPRFYTEPPKSGATKGMITKLEDVNKLLDIYYEQRGWTSNGMPTPETLSSLELAGIVV